jgi:hypothetical protein
MARIGPARPNSSLNDESIEVQPFHPHPRDDAEVRRAYRIGMSILGMHRAQDERRALRARLRHEPERPPGVETSPVTTGSEVRSSTKSNEMSSVLHIGY